MSRARARALAACGLCLGVGVVFFLCAVWSLHVPLYFPLGRRWGLAAGPGELSMDYYGRSLYALLGGAAAGLLSYGGARALRGPPDGDGSRRGLGLWLAYALTALGLCTCLYGYKLMTRDLRPEPLPAWYQPR